MQHYYNSTEYQALIEVRETLASEHIGWTNEWTRRTDLMLSKTNLEARHDALDFRDELIAVMKNLRQRQTENEATTQAIRTAYDDHGDGLLPA